jgi:uncharacterized membrane protein
MNLLFVAACLFFFLHLLPSTPLRPALVASLGEAAYSAVFSIASLVALWWLVRIYESSPYGDKLWDVPAWWLWLKAILILLSLILAVGGLLTANPSSPGVGKALESNPTIANGVFAITRHPVMWGAAIWAIAHIISQATVRGFLFFGALAATALIGTMLQEKRKRKTVIGWMAFEAKTSYIPLAAIFAGRAHLKFKALGWWRIAIAVILWALIVHFHLWLFGAQPLPVHT